MSNYYYDYPVEEPVAKRKKPKVIFASALLLFAGGLFLNTTLEANIKISTGGYFNNPHTVRPIWAF